MNSVTVSGDKTWYAPDGDWVVWAPGALNNNRDVQIGGIVCAAGSGDGTQRRFGTCLSTAEVTGLAAYILSVEPDLGIPDDGISVSERVKDYIKEYSYSRNPGQPEAIWNGLTDYNTNKRLRKNKREASICPASLPTNLVSLGSTGHAGTQTPQTASAASAASASAASAASTSAASTTSTSTTSSTSTSAVVSASTASTASAASAVASDQLTLEGKCFWAINITSSSVVINALCPSLNSTSGCCSLSTLDLSYCFVNQNGNVAPWAMSVSLFLFLIALILPISIIRERH